VQKHVAVVVDKRKAYWDLVGATPKEVFLFEVMGVDGRIILNWILLDQNRDK
jgi:hypothetical protein